MIRSVGVTGTLSFQGLSVPGGFVLIDTCLYIRELGAFQIGLKWFLTKHAFDEHLDDVKSDGFPRLDPIQYVVNSDPVMTAAVAVKNWFPDGEIVVEEFNDVQVPETPPSDG